MLHRTLLAVLALLAVLSASPASSTAAENLDTLKRAFARPNDIPFPPENSFTPEKAALGKALFFDPIFSGSGTISCASCHHPGLAWGDGLPRAIGEARTPLPVRSPTLLNLAWGELY